MLDPTSGKTKIMEKALDASWLRNEVISNNIANVNTPGFKKSDVKFEEFLSDSVIRLKMPQTENSDKFIPIGNTDIPDPFIETERFTSSRRDENNVDVDVEMAELAKNTVKYNALVAQLTKQFSRIKLVLNNGR